MAFGCTKYNSLLVRLDICGEQTDRTVLSIHYDLYAFSRIIGITHTIAYFGKSIPIMPALLTYYALNYAGRFFIFYYYLVFIIYYFVFITRQNRILSRKQILTHIGRVGPKETDYNA